MSPIKIKKEEKRNLELHPWPFFGLSFFSCIIFFLKVKKKFIVGPSENKMIELRWQSLYLIVIKVPSFKIKPSSFSCLRISLTLSLSKLSFLNNDDS